MSGSCSGQDDIQREAIARLIAETNDDIVLRLVVYAEMLFGSLFCRIENISLCKSSARSSTVPRGQLRGLGVVHVLPRLNSLEQSEEQQSNSS